VTVRSELAVERGLVVVSRERSLAF
jgi:hypothetical protein